MRKRFSNLDLGKGALGGLDGAALIGTLFYTWTSLTTVEWSAQASLAPFICRREPFLPYLFTGVSSSSLSLSHSFFSNIELSPSKFHPSLDLTLLRPQSHISPWIDSLRYTPHPLPFIRECTINLTLVLNEIPHLGLKLFLKKCAFLIGD
jgi:hypothetical protein